MQLLLKLGLFLRGQPATAYWNTCEVAREQIVEEKIAELAAQVATLQASSSVTNAMFAEAYYYLTIPLMVLIHPRFLVYEIVHPG